MARTQPRSITLPGGMPLVIRTVDPADAAAMIAMNHHIAATSEFNVTQPDEVRGDEAEERNRIDEFLEAPGAVWLAAISARPGAGCAGVVGELSFRSIKPRRMRHHGHFGISVHQEWRGRGVGRALLESLIEWARNHEFIERIDLGVFAGNTPARSLYRTMGFEEVGVRWREFKIGPDEYMDDVQMSLWVK